jgi:valyl-tRNA synthetase
VENLGRRGTVQIVSGDATYVLTPGSDAIFIDLSGEESRLKREQAKAQKEAEALERKLGNAEFVARADPEVVAETRDRLESARAEVARLQAALARIG